MARNRIATWVKPLTYISTKFFFYKRASLISYPLYHLHGYVLPPKGIGFEPTAIEFAHYGLKSSIVFKRTTKGYWGM